MSMSGYVSFYNGVAHAPAMYLPPSLAGYPPLPPSETACALRRAKPSAKPSASPAAARWRAAKKRRAPTSPFAGWSPHKAFAFPYDPDGLQSDAATCVLELVQLGAGLREDLSPQLESEVGLDPFNYEVRGLLAPCLRMRKNLKAALVYWALNWPEALLHHLFHESVGSVLGGAFPWACFGEAKTLWSHPDHAPW